MMVLRHPDQLDISLGNVQRVVILASLLPLLQQRFTDLGAGVEYSSEQHGFIVVVEPGDDVNVVETASGCPILKDCFGDTHYGDADFAPAFEYLDDHPFSYEMTFNLNDNGFTVLIFVPKLNGIDQQLTSLCREMVQQNTD